MPFEALPPNSNIGTIGEAHLDTLCHELHREHPEYRNKRTLPAEWAAQSAIQLTWPHRQTDWKDLLPEVTTLYLRIAYEIATRQSLIIVHPDTDMLRALLTKHMPQVVLDNIHLLEAPTNDTWARDHAFLTVVGTRGGEFMDFRFNGWGGKFDAYLDNDINRLLFKDGRLKGRYQDCNDFELEGGAIESDGMGTLLTTEACLLNPNRRRKNDKVPTPDRRQVELLLQERLGIDRVLWLKHGYLAGDDTDSHIDTLARFCPDQTIVYVKSYDTTDEHHKALEAMESELRAFRTAQGKPYRLVPLPLPAPCYDEEGERLPATYANFLIMNQAVLLPTYDQTDNDRKAMQTLQQVFPRHEIVGIDCRLLIRQHGSLHCATMQYPRGVFIH